MSGIAGVYNLDGDSVDPEALRRMVKTMDHRGPDGVDTWCEGSLGLGNLMMWTTPESMLEKLPLVNLAGDLVLISDSRIDNRDELISVLEFNDRPAEKVTDSDLILAAYSRWGRDCPSKFIGDFAFAIWDATKHVVFCARDYMGVKPFYYHYQPDKLFAFASEIKGLFCLDSVPKKVNDAKVGIYLCHLGGYSNITPDTFYEDIFRLLPAHWMEVSAKGIESESFWDLDAEAQKLQKCLTTDEEYVEEFRKRFTESVDCRLRSAYPIVSTLSGGLDSSTVSCVARTLLQDRDSNAKLNTIYNDCETPECDEKDFVNTVLAQGGFNHHIVKVKNPITSAQDFAPWLDQPIQMPTPAMLLAVLKSSREQGHRIILTGFDGDTVVCHGSDYLNELVELGAWSKIKKIIEIFHPHKNDFNDDSIDEEIERILYRNVIPYAQKLVRNLELKKYLRMIHGIADDWNFSKKRIFKLLLRSIYNNVSGIEFLRWISHNEYINKKFARRIHLNNLIKNRKKNSSTNFVSQFSEHYRAIVSQEIQDATAQLDCMSSGFRTEFRHPFMDRRVIELCLAAPSHLKFCNSYGRGIMRCAMKGILSEEVRHRKSKAEFFDFIVTEIKKSEQGYLEALISENKSILSDYVNIEDFQQYHRRFIKCKDNDKHNNRMSKIISRTSYLGIWLKFSQESYLKLN